MKISSIFDRLPAFFPLLWRGLLEKDSPTRHFAAFALLFLLLVCCGFFQALPVGAQGEDPAWKRNLACDDDLKKYRGLEYCTGLGGKAHVIVIDLHDPGIRFEYVIASGLDRDGNQVECRDVNVPAWSDGPGCRDPQNPAYYPVMSLFTAVPRYPEAAVVINSDYGAGTQGKTGEYRGHGPEGFAVIQGTRIDGTQVGDVDDNAANRPWLAVGGSPLRVELSTLTADDGSAPGWVYTGVGGAPWLIDQGVVQETRIAGCENASPHSCASTYGQTAVGITADKRWLFLVLVLEKNAQGAAEFMKTQLDAWSAIKFDGGGSAQLYYGGKEGDTVNQKVIYRGDGRWLSNYLAVIAEPGTGIDLETGQPTLTVTPPADVIPPTPQPTPPGPGPLARWWDDLSKFFKGLGGKKIDGFGMGSSTHIRVGAAQMDAYFAAQEELGVGWIREEFPWEEIESQLGKCHWDYAFEDRRRNFDRMLSQAAERNLRVMGVLVYGPKAGSDPTEEELLAGWEAYVRAVVTCYGSQVDAWEIGNEMNSRFFWGKVVHPASKQDAAPNPGLYAKMLRIAHGIIKEHDPDGVVVLGGLVTLSGPPACETNPFVFLKGIHDAGAWDAFDVIGFHPYWNAYSLEWPIARGLPHDLDTGECLAGERTDTLIGEVRKLRRLAGQWGAKPVWITELGWDRPWLETLSSQRGASPDAIEADYVARVYVPLLSEEGVENIFWYTLVGDTQEQDFVLGAAGQRAYRNLSALLSGSKPLGQVQGQNDQNRPADDDVYEYRFKKAGQTVIVLWKARGGDVYRDVTVRDVPGETVRAYPLDAPSLDPSAGSELPVQDGTLTLPLNEHPLILIAGQGRWWDPLTGWWDGWSFDPIGWFNDWWAGVRQKIIDLALQWLGEQLSSLWALAIQTANDLIEQACGCRPVPVGLVAGFAALSRLRRMRHPPAH